MSDPNTPAGNAPAAAPTSTPSAPAVTPPAAADPAAAPEPGKEPNWLPMRLEQAKKSATTAMLKELGVDSPEALKAAVESAKKLADEKKSEIDKREDRIKQLEPAAAEAARFREMAARLAAGTMTTLTAEQQAAVKAIAGDDHAKQLETIEAMRPTWAAAAKSAPAATPPSTATTAPPPSAPGGGAPPAPTPRATYEATRQQNPFAAALFGVTNPEVYNPK